MIHSLPRRALAYALTLFAAVSINFFLPRAMPGEPIALLAGDAARRMGAQRIAQLRREYGLDRPLLEQYAAYLGRLARGDLGQSYRYSGGRSVAQLLADRLAWTLGLATASLALSTLAGSALGIYAARRFGRAADLGLLAGLYALRSMPPFWLAMLFISVFAVGLGWFPSGDSYSVARPAGLAGLIDVARHAVLPVTVLALSHLPVSFAVMRASMLGVLGADYVRAARARGASERRALFRHALRNALLPVVTAFALDFGQLLGGATLIEIVFNYRGIGSLMFEAVKSRDYPLVQGGFLAFTLGVLTINLLNDWLYARLDPRLRHARA
jgi:peptide/nickel transport system permease protein